MNRLLATAAAVLTTGAALAETPVGVIEAEMCRGFFFVDLTLEAKPDQPEDRTLHLVYDTGASATTLNIHGVRKVTNSRIETGNRVSIENASMGPLKINGMSARTSDLRHLEVTLGREIDGILGYRFFEPFLVTLDYENGEIALSEGDLPSPDGRTVFDTDGPDERPWVVLDIDGRKRRVLIDSGSTGSLSVNRLDRYDLQQPAQSTGVATRFDRLERRASGRLDGTVRLGSIAIEDPMLSNAQKSELLGAQILSYFDVTFDIDDERVRFRPNGRGPVETESVTTPGMFLRPRGEAFEVLETLPGSSAEKAGIAAGDTVTHIGGAPIATRGCETNDELETQTYRIVQGGKAREVELPIVTLVP